MNKTNSHSINNSASKLCFGRMIGGIHTLGPGTRICLWLQGCSMEPKCQGCTSPEYHAYVPEKNISVDVLADFLLCHSTSNRLTISGGEPLDQASSLYELLIRIRNTFEDILLYTGKTLEHLTSEQKQVISLVDVVIDGPYIQKLDDGKCILRGSTNQKIHFTNRCPQTITHEYLHYMNNMSKRQTEFIPCCKNILEIGIPTHS